jgi:hypothetical protein
MQFATCSHGNIEMTCPQCKGRQPAAPAAVSGFGLPVQQAVPAGMREDEGGDLEERAAQRVIATSDRQARQVRGFWSQINAPTTVAEHNQLHAQ